MMVGATTEDDMKTVVTTDKQAELSARASQYHSLQKRLLSVKEVASLSGLGVTTIYGLMNSGALRALKVGGLTKITSEDYEAFVKGLEPRSA